MKPIVYTISPHNESSGAAKRQYILEEYRGRGTPEYNPLHETFRSISPSESVQYPSDRRAGMYDRQLGNYSGPEQQRHNFAIVSAQRQPLATYRRDAESPPTSEISFAMEKLGGDPATSNNSKAPKRPRRRALLNNIFDFVALAATCLVFGLIYLFVKPVQRGFFCDDTSIQYPFKPDTIPMWLLGIYGGVGPVVIFCIVEIWVVRPFQCGRGPARASLKQRQVDYLKCIFQSTFLFLLGIAICFLITEVGKRTIGRLRPYYLTVCNPIWANINCTKTVMAASGQVAIYQYVLDHHCNTTESASALQEAKLSFPSGHSSYSTYAFVFLFVYFEARLVCPNIQFLKPFLQCLCIAVAFFTCLSRVTDYKHHATDVIGGAIIGFCIAVFAAVRVGTYLWSFSVYCETEEETAKDRLPKEERVPIPGVETRQSGALRSNDHIQLEALPQPRSLPSNAARPRNNSRATYDGGLSSHQSQKNTVHPSVNGGGNRRVGAGKAFDDTYM